MTKEVVSMLQPIQDFIDRNGLPDKAMQYSNFISIGVVEEFAGQPGGDYQEAFDYPGKEKELAVLYEESRKRYAEELHDRGERPFWEPEENAGRSASAGWPPDFPAVTTLVSYIDLRHSTDPAVKELYDRAKNREDREAAAGLINRLMTSEGMEKIKSLGEKHAGAMVVSTHAVEGQGKNALPHALAEFIGKYGNLNVDEGIIQTDIVKRTGENSWYRFAHRPHFEGTVQAGREYILVDDVFSAGGTFSEMRQFIESNGGKVVDAVALANGARSMNAQLAPAPGRALELEHKYGVESLQKFLKEEQLYGGNYKALTDAEARTLLGAPSLDEARDRIAAARQERSERILPEVVRGASLDAAAVTHTPEQAEGPWIPGVSPAGAQEKRQGRAQGEAEGEPSPGKTPAEPESLAERILQGIKETVASLDQQNRIAAAAESVR